MRQWLVLVLVCACPFWLEGCFNRNSAAPALPKVETIPANTAPLVAAKHGRVYHLRGCCYAAALKDSLGFATAQEAEKAGYIPCEFCRPQTLKTGAAEVRSGGAPEGAAR